MTYVTVRVPLTVTAGDGGERELSMFLDWLGTRIETGTPPASRPVTEASDRLVAELVREWRREEALTRLQALRLVGRP